MPEQDVEQRTRKRALRQKLESLQRAGVTQIVRVPQRAKATVISTTAPPQTRTAAPASRQSPPPTAPPARAPAPSPAGASVPPSDRQSALDVIQKEVKACAKCPELCQTRTQTVFGVGNVHPRLVFVGEAPGADEDLQGEPFVGRAGQLLNKIIEACTLKREDVYILNVLKCRPPGNRNPAPQEVANCRGFLDRQLDILQPEFICCLGTYAAQAVLNTDEPIGRLRGQFREYRGIPVMSVYHPSYLLRNPSAKKIVWDDMKLLLARMGITPKS